MTLGTAEFLLSLHKSSGISPLSFKILVCTSPLHLTSSCQVGDSVLLITSSVLAGLSHEVWAQASSHCTSVAGGWRTTADKLFLSVVLITLC